MEEMFTIRPRCGNVHLPAGRLPAMPRDLRGNLLSPVAIEIGDDNCEAIRREPSGNGLAYAGRTSGHDGYTCRWCAVVHRSTRL
jgi:hypothetical protein